MEFAVSSNKYLHPICPQSYFYAHCKIKPLYFFFVATKIKTSVSKQSNLWMIVGWSKINKMCHKILFNFFWGHLLMQKNNQKRYNSWTEVMGVGILLCLRQCQLHNFKNGESFCAYKLKFLRKKIGSIVMPNYTHLISDKEHSNIL